MGKLYKVVYGCLYYNRIERERNITTHTRVSFPSILFNIMLYSFNLVTANTSMENSRIQKIERLQPRNTLFLDELEPKTQRLETATEFSSNQYDDEASQNASIQTDLPDLKRAPELNDMQKKLEAETQQRNEIQNPNRIIRKGYLEKQTGSILNRWQISYGVLTVSKLYLFQDDNMINLRSCINFATHKASLSREQLAITIRVDQFEQALRIKVYTEREAQWWEHDIGSIILYHISSCKISLMQSKKCLYQQKDAMTEKEFLETAETGDVILMSTTDTQSAIQRFVTNSQFDHVGLIVNFNGEVKIFESNADEGVNVYNWAQFTAEFHQYQKIAIRKLHSHRKNDLQPFLMKFIKSTIGKKYDLQALKLMRKSSEDEGLQRGYFCSELVAKVYKKFGLLEADKASSKYWPVDFTTRGGLNLLDSASLGEERLVILNKHVKFHS